MKDEEGFLLELQNSLNGIIKQLNHLTKETDIARWNDSAMAHKTMKIEEVVLQLQKDIRKLEISLASTIYRVSYLETEIKELKINNEALANSSLEMQEVLEKRVKE
jgi:hypothetical protein